MFFKRVADTVKSGLSKGKVFANNQIKALPENIQRGRELVKGARQFAEKVGSTANKIEQIANKNQLIPEKYAGKAKKVFDTTAQGVKNIQKFDDKVGKVVADAGGLF